MSIAKVLIDGNYLLDSVAKLGDIGVDLTVLRKHFNRFDASILCRLTYYTNASNRMTEWLRFNGYRVKIRARAKHDYLFDMVADMTRLDNAAGVAETTIITGEPALLPYIDRLRDNKFIRVISDYEEFRKHADEFFTIDEYLDITQSKTARNFTEEALRGMTWLDKPTVPDDPRELVHQFE